MALGYQAFYGIQGSLMHRMAGRGEPGEEARIDEVVPSPRPE
jgi:hypothetical protein